MGLFKKYTISLGTQFAIMINIVVLTTVISMAAYYIFVAGKLNMLSYAEKEIANKALSNIIFSVLRNDLQSNNASFVNISNISKDLIQNDLIAFIAIRDGSNKLVWSSVTGATGTTKSIEELTIDYLSTKPYLGNYNSKISHVIGYTGKYQIVVGFHTESSIAWYIRTMLENNKILAITFLLLCFISAFLMAKSVNKMLNNLIVGAEELSKGNLKYKINYTEYAEINKLVDAFNAMAEKLDQSYSLLEQKVKDRTEELYRKNKELAKANQDIKEAQAMIVHSEKMRSLGELVAGITHEINNPVNFIYGNIIHLNNYTKDLIEIIEKYTELEGKLPEEDKEAINKLKEQVEYDFLKEDIPELIRSCKDGAERTKNIILDLKSFSRMEEMVINDIDIHKEIDTTLNILHNKYKNRITVKKEFSDIPTVESYGGQLNQVFMNILDNAAYAIKDEGEVIIKTYQVDDKVVIEFIDNGCGIPKEHLDKICDPFFTTKPVGQGTGLGMSISYKVIKNHNGDIKIDSVEGEGTKVTVSLPISGLKAKVKEDSTIMPG